LEGPNAGKSPFSRAFSRPFPQAMDAFMSRDAAHAAPWAAAPLAVAPAPGRVMKASAAASVGSKKKNKRTRPESVQAWFFLFTMPPLSLFEPQRFAVEWDKESFAANRPLMFDLLAGLKGVPAGVRSGLDAEFVLYETEVRDYLARLAVNPSLNSPTHLWMWWSGLRFKLPSFFAVASVLILMQPSSASIERFFSTVKANSSAQQNGESHETLALRCLCLYNTP
jgi:hypothetical protein